MSKVMLYKKGKTQKIHGVMVDYKVFSEEEAGTALESGWYDSPQKAAEAKQAEAPKDDDAPPTRDELKQKAEELGLNFDSRTSSAKLSKMIDKALG